MLTIYKEKILDFRFKFIKINTIIIITIFFNVQGFAQKINSRLHDSKFPIVAGLQFQNFAMPFLDIKSNFTHPGLFVGSEISYNNKETLIQQAIIGSYINREIGNGTYLSTQFGYRPKIYKNLYSELKVGLNYLHVFYPTKSYKYENGIWQENIGGKSQVGIPFDLGFGYSFTSDLGKMSPFILYQINPSFFYNKTLPVNIYSSFLIGLRIQFLKHKP